MDHVTADDVDPVEISEGGFLAPLAAGERLSMQRFELEPGRSAPAHSHPHEQGGYVVSGTLTLTVAGETYEVGAGDSYVVPGGVEHAASNEADAVVEGVEVFSPPREGVPGGSSE